MNRKKRENAPQEEVFMESAPPQGNDFSAGRGGRIAAKAILLGLPLLLCAGVITGAVSQGLYNRGLEESNQTLRQQIIKKEYDLQNNMDSLNDEFVIASMKTLFGLGNLSYDMRRYWNYELTVNGAAVSGDRVSVPAGTVTVSLKQTQKANSFPYEVVGLGSTLGGDSDDKLSYHCKVTGASGVEASETEDGLLTVLTYTFAAQKGDALEIHLSYPLADQLGLAEKYGYDFNTIAVNVA